MAGSALSRSVKAARALFMVRVDSRPWWHSMHRLASTGTRLPLSSFVVLKVRETPDGNGTLVTARRSGILAVLWQVLHSKPFETGWPTTPVIWTPDLVTTSVPALAIYCGMPVALWHLAQAAGTTPVLSQSRNGMVLPAK